VVVITSTAMACSLAYHVYPRMKVRHMINLYRAIPSIMAEDKKREATKRQLFVQDVSEIRLFLWDGSQIAAARRPTDNTLHTGALQVVASA
jgi:hypothetical protein